MFPRFLAVLVAVVAPLATQARGQNPVQSLATVPGWVMDLSVTASGELLYCTEGGEVGTLSTAGVRTVLATGVGAHPLRGVVETPAGDVTVVDEPGNLWRLSGGGPPAVKFYSDLYMIHQPRDLVVDAAGNYAIPSRTPTSGVRGVNWVSPDGANWAYYLVAHQPLALAADPLGPNLILADAAGGGGLRLVDAADAGHPTAPLDTQSSLGFSVAGFDGDLACEADGDVLAIAGGTVWRHRRSTGATTIFKTAPGSLTGIAIAASSGNLASPSGWSAYVAEGANPTTIWEIANVGAPASVVATDLGLVPSRGIALPFFPGINVFELASDGEGNLLFGGDLWGSKASVSRVELPAGTVTQVAGPGDGISSRVEGITVGEDGAIYALTSAGRVHRIEEDPLAVTTVFTDPGNAIGTAKGFVPERGGGFFVADYQSWGNGHVFYLASDLAGPASSVLSTVETRGIAVDPFTVGLLVTEWHDIGFCGTVGRLDPLTHLLDPLPGFEGMNYSNAGSWPDGDSVVDAAGNVYTCSEDDFSVHRYVPATGQLSRVGSGYLNHPSGVAIARSTAGSGSATGWSLYVSEYITVWEIPGVPPPAPELLDRDAPPVGRFAAGLSPEHGQPRAMVPAPGGGGFWITTDAARLLAVDLATGATTVLAGAGDGLQGDLVALAVASDGHPRVVNREGVVFELDPDASFAVSVRFADPGGLLHDVRGLALDGSDRELLVEGAQGSEGGRLHRLDAGVLEPLAFTARGLRPAVDPLTGDVFVSERGSSAEGAGELLRVDPFASPPTAGHHRLAGYETFRSGPFDGALAFDAEGNLYLGAGDTGRVERLDRSTGARTSVAGNYRRPTALVLAPGRAGTAGIDGTSLFVLDGYALFEVGVAGLPAPAPPALPPGLAPPADLSVVGDLVPGTKVPIAVESPDHAGKAYVVLLSLSGKVPGFPLALLNPADPRVLPNNADLLWNLIGLGSVTPQFVGFLDAQGRSPAAAGLVVPNDPSLLLLGEFMDLVWMTLEPGAPSGVGHIGGTAQIFFGS